MAETTGTTEAPAVAGTSPAPAPVAAPSPVTAPAAAPVNTPSYSKVFKEDGSFDRDALKAHVPDDFKGLAVYDTFADLPSLMKLVGNQAKLIVRQGKGVQPPAADATETEKNAFYEAIGRPKTAGDYEIKVPKELESFTDKASLDGFREIAFKEGMTPRQVAAVMAYHDQLALKGIASSAAEQKAAVTQAEVGLREEYGAAFDAKVHQANFVLNKAFTDPAKMQAFAEKHGNDPDYVRVFSSLYSLFKEGRSVPADIESNVLTPTEAKNKMDEMIQQQIAIKATNPSNAVAMNAEIRRLSQLATHGQ